MRRTRFTTWFFLELSLAFFCLRDLRVALESPLVALLPYGWSGGFGTARAALSSEEELYGLYKPRA